jgi:hypothetical protein
MGPEAQAALPALREVLADPQLAAYRPYYALALSKIDRQARSTSDLKNPGAAR